ncbi:MarR family transcriptional regulator [Desulfosporosinus fructosivorans]|uniref:MarR family transcriptional regulator n=1 Tax=Desulfosporosinus fructosivorans TaxID=2018669 RepID=A0A4Z0R6A5_9FIRM|nr:MarR family winged helix-turn-helix transcriptional regulator [Desulfosporosinus fructosivorans]TGE38572.1 MarR family transcriptional regulator [Desulfosporosinus fructosivorans]
MNYYETRELHDLLFSFLDMFHEKFLHHFRKRNESKSGMKKNHVKIIVMIYRFEGLTSTDIAKMLDMEKGSVTTLIDQLTECGFVVRCDVAHDRRKSLILLTDLGKAQMECIIESHIQSMNELLECIDSDEMKQFVDSLGNVVKFMNKL